MKFGTWFKHKRVQADLSQGDIARDLNYSTSQFISNWERGLSLPPRPCIPKLSKSLGVSEREIKSEIFQQKLNELEKEWL